MNIKNNVERCKDCGVELHTLNKAMCVKCGAPICEDCMNLNKFKCKDCNPQKPKFDLDYIRRSHIEDYKDCPYYFYLEVIKGIEVPPTIYAKIGIELHELYDKHQKGEIDDTQVYSGTLEAIESCRNVFNDELVDKMEKRAKLATEGYFKVIKNFEGKLLTTEQTLFLNVKDGLPKIRITFDMLREDEEGNLHILDYKTGQVMVGKHLATNLQVPLYIKAVQDNYQKPVKSFTLLYLYEDKIRKYEYIGGDRYECEVRKRKYGISLNDSMKEVQTLFSRIKGGKFSIPEKPNYFRCNNCYFRTIGKCSGSDTQKWINANGKEEDFIWQ